MSSEAALEGAAVHDRPTIADTVNTTSHAAITVENLGKRYALRHQRGRDGLRHGIESALRSPMGWVRSRRERRKQANEVLWALRDVSFSVAPGEAVGIIGRNGAGKSTLLKLLSRITEPTTGQIRYRGRVSSLLEVGTGFHPELTGRENIFLNAAILGMRRADILRRFDEIVAFAEVERFLDTPVKRYSSGMYVRLAFAVAAHLEPEILLVDEVLAVGDVAFQQKCMGKMGNVVRQGRTILFVSHNMAAISGLCSRGLLIDDGRMVLSGEPQTVIEAYLATLRTCVDTPISERTDRLGDGRLRFTKVTFVNNRCEAVDTVVSGQAVTVVVEYELRGTAALQNAVFQIKFFDALGRPLFACLTQASYQGPLTLRSGARLLCHIPSVALQPGIYPYSIYCTVGGVLEDSVPQAGNFRVVEGDFFGTGRLPKRETGDVLMNHTWSVD